MDEERLVALLTDLKESLLGEISGGRGEVRTGYSGLTERFDALLVRLDTHASDRLAAQNAQAIAALRVEVSDLKRRLSDLEQHGH